MLLAVQPSLRTHTIIARFEIFHVSSFSIVNILKQLFQPGWKVNNTVYQKEKNYPNLLPYNCRTDDIYIIIYSPDFMKKIY